MNTNTLHASHDKTAIDIQKLCKSFGTLKAVNQMDMTVYTGEIFALLGVNGAGKTTMINMLTGRLWPTDGDAFVKGLSIRNQMQKIKPVISVSPQDTAVAGKLTVRENLEFIAGIYGYSKAVCRTRADAMIEKFHLQEVSKRRAQTLSGGWQRRLSIAMALVSEPEILFLDEPTVALDVLARHDLWQFIQTLKGQITIILTTHYLEEAEALADRIGIMNNGHLKAVGTVNEIILTAQTDTFENAFIKLARGGAQI